MLVGAAGVGESRNLIFRIRSAAVLAGWTGISCYGNAHHTGTRVSLEFLKVRAETEKSGKTAWQDGHTRAESDDWVKQREQVCKDLPPEWLLFIRIFYFIC